MSQFFSDNLYFLIETKVKYFIERGIVANRRAIGDGHCYDFAEQIFQSIPEDVDIRIAYTEDYWKRAILPDGSPDPDEAEMFVMDIDRLKAEGVWLPHDIPHEDLSLLLGQATHAWLVFNGRHYDATSPEGKEHFTQMPFFADQITGYQKELSKGQN